MAKRQQAVRDIYKYHYWWRGKVVHRGITDDLGRREQEHNEKWPGGHITQVGNRTSREAALKWEREGGKRPKKYLIKRRIKGY